MSFYTSPRSFPGTRAARVSLRRYTHAQQAILGLLLLAVFGSLLAATHTPVRAPHADPRLLQLAATHPGDTVRLIVRTQPGAAIDDQIRRLAGRITHQFSFINAVAVDAPAAVVADLAALPGVIWVSLDAPTTPAQTSASAVFTSWATRPGVTVPTSFTAAENILSVVGPNGSYASGSTVKGAFGGFTFEVNPDFTVNKVELLLRTYVPTALSLTSTPRIAVSIGGRIVTTKTIPAGAFNAFVGPAQAGTVSIELLNGATFTPSQFAQWQDLIKTVEVIIDQTSLASNQVIFYDAIGLRVTSVPGTAATTTTVLPVAPTAGLDTTALQDAYDSAVGANAIWNEAPAYHQGQGVTVAVVDSGVNASADLDGRVLANVNFNTAYHDSTDRYGHGTHVASIIAANGKQSSGQHIGIAPKANILNVRVSDDLGRANESDVVAGLQWIYENRQRYQIRVVNLSLNSSVAQSYHTSPLAAAVEILWFNGIVVVVSAGNSGSAALYPPANDPFVITVGATDDRTTGAIKDDVISSFSAYGQTENGQLKPDLVAPGTNLIALVPDNGQLTVGKQHRSNAVSQNYFRMSGTSMAAPVVSGAVALLLRDEPTLTPDQVKYRLKATAVRDTARWPGYVAAKAGAGYLDIKAAIHGTTSASANTGTEASHMLWTGTEPLTWGSASWNSASWNSASWNSASWNSASWNSASWNSDYWAP